jgi:hypothetical protein
MRSTTKPTNNAAPANAFEKWVRAEIKEQAASIVRLEKRLFWGKLVGIGPAYLLVGIALKARQTDNSPGSTI